MRRSRVNTARPLAHVGALCHSLPMTTNTRIDLLTQLDVAVRRANLSDKLGTFAERLAERRAATVEVARIRAELAERAR